MRKYLSFIIIAIFALVLTGCGKKTLKCVNKDDETAGNITATLKGDKVIKVVTNYSVEFETEEQAISAVKDAEADEELDNTTTTYKRDGRSVEITIEEDLNKNKISKEDYLKQVETIGYTCK